MAKELHLFDFDNYKTFLNHRCHSERGIKTALATAIGCQSAYISQVLNDNAQLSLEQADQANYFFKHSDKEAQYFMLLVQMERAGTKSLKKYFEQQLSEFVEHQLSYLKRHDLKSKLDDKDKAIYYSSWEYTTLHMAVTIPRLQKKETLMMAFAISEARFNKCVEFLLETGLIIQHGDQYRPGPAEVYLEKASPFVRQLHLNNRSQALASLDRERAEDAHYSAVITLSGKDVIKVKKIINEALADIVNLAKDSSEEQICGLSFDFFDIEKTKQ